VKKAATITLIVNGIGPKFRQLAARVKENVCSQSADQPISCFMLIRTLTEIHDDDGVSN
jgi:hypothetical protein